jgi:hypothetical protein
LQDHPKDAEYLNVPIVNYQFMQTIFGSGVATCRHAMGSNEPLGTPVAEEEVVDLEKQDEEEKAVNSKGKRKAEADVKVDKGKGKCKAEATKKKRGMIPEDAAALMTGFTDAIWGLNATLSEGNHSEAAPGIYDAVMGYPGFARTDLMTYLNYLMEHKALAMVFMGMSSEDKELWIHTYLDKVRTKMAFQ